jgi:hypothetical protein
MDKTKCVFNLDNYLKDIDLKNFYDFPKARDGSHFGKYVQETLAYEFTKKILKHV